MKGIKKKPLQDLEAEIYKISEAIKSYEILTEREEAHHNHDELEKYKAIANYSASWEAWFDAGGKLTWMNPFSEELTGFTPEEYKLADDFLELFSYPEDLPKVREKFLQAIQGSSGFNFESRVMRKDGTNFWASISWRPMFDAHNHSIGFRTSAQNITDRKNTELALKENEAKLRELNASKDKFLSIISHDLRAPFNGLLGLTDILVDEENLLPQEEVQTILKLLNQTTHQTYNLLETLLEWARMTGGFIEFKPLTLPVGILLTELLDHYAEVANHKSIEMKLSVGGELTVVADNYMLQTILRNLISNALKFTRKGNTVNISATQQSDAILFAVQDTGIGMSPVMLQNLFEIGHNSKRTGTDGELSSGIGLYLCRDFVKKHGGIIWAISEEGKGSTFYFTIPNHCPAK